MMLVDSAAENPRTLKLISVAVHSARPPMTGTRDRLTSSPEKECSQSVQLPVPLSHGRCSVPRGHAAEGARLADQPRCEPGPRAVRAMAGQA